MNHPPWQQSIYLLVLASLLSACANFGPQHTPSTLLDAQQLALPEKSSTVPQTGWWRQLHDEQLNKLIDQALARSPSIKLAADRLAEAHAATGLNESAQGPQIDAQASKDRQLYSANGLFPPPIGGNYVNSYTLSLNAVWALDFWGKQRARVSAALGQARAAAYEVAQAELTLTAAVMGQYTTLQRQCAQIGVNQSRLQLAQTQRRLLSARTTAGLLSADSLHRVEQAIANLQAQNTVLRADIQRTRHALAALTGQNPSALDGLTPPSLGNTPAMDEAHMTANLLGRRPDIASQREQVASMEKNVQAVRADFYPNINISALIGLNSLTYGKLFQQNSKIVDFQPAISLPIFHSGQLHANLRVEQSRYDQAVDSYNQAVLNGLKEAADALTSQQQATKQLTDTHRSLVASTKQAQAMQLRMKAGIVGKLEALDSQDNQLVQESTYLDTLAAARVAWVNLNTALGGGITVNIAPTKD